MIGVVTGALRRTTVRDQLVLEVHPDDFELVRDAAEDLADRVGGIHRIDVVAERRVDRGGCVVRTVEGEIDAGIGAAAGSRRRDLRATPCRSRPAMIDASLNRLSVALQDADLHHVRGRVTNLIGLVIECTGLRAEVGELCSIATGRNRPDVPAEVVGFRDGPDTADAARQHAGDRPRHPGLGHRRLVPGAGRRPAAGTGAGRPRPPDRRWPCDPRQRASPRSRSAAVTDGALDDRPPAAARRAHAGHAGAVRPRPAAGDLRRLRCRQVEPAGHDRPLDPGVGQRHLPGRRARPRAARVHRA